MTFGRSLNLSVCQSKVDSIYRDALNTTLVLHFTCFVFFDFHISCVCDLFHNDHNSDIVVTTRKATPHPNRLSMDWFYFASNDHFSSARYYLSPLLNFGFVLFNLSNPKAICDRTCCSAVNRQRFGQSMKSLIPGPWARRNSHGFSVKWIFNSPPSTS